MSAVAILAALVCGGAAWMYIKLARGDYNSWILSFALEKTNQRLAGQVEVEELVGNPLEWIALNKIVVVDPDNEKVIKAEKAVVSYVLFKNGKFSPHLEIEAHNVWVKAEKQGDKWNLSRLRKKRPGSGKPSSYPPLSGKIYISSLQVHARSGAEKTYDVTVAEAAGTFKTEDNAVGFEIEELTGFVSPPDVPLEAAAINGKAYNTGSGWDVRIHSGSVQSRNSGLKLGQGRYFTGTSELEARIPEIKATPETIEAVWAGNPLKTTVTGSAEVWGNIRNIGFKTDISSSSGSLVAGGTYARPKNVLDLKGSIKNMSVQELIENDVPLTGLFGKFDLKYVLPAGSTPRSLRARFDLESFSYPRIKSFPLSFDVELTGEAYKGSVVSRSPGRGFSADVNGKLKKPYPFNLQTLFNELDPSTMVENAPQALLTGDLELGGSGTNKDDFRGQGTLHLQQSTVKDMRIKDARLVYTMAAGRFRAESMRALSDRLEMEGTGWIEPFHKALPFSFETRAKLLDPSLVTELTKGRLSLEKAKVNADVSGNRYYWQAAGKGEAAGVKASGVQSESASVKLALSGKGADSVRGKAELDFAGFFIPGAKQGKLRVPVMDVTASADIKPSPLQGPRIDFSIDTKAKEPGYALASQGSVNMDGGKQFDLFLQKLDLTVIGQKWILSSPAQVTSRRGAISFKGFQLEKDKSTLGAFGEIKENNTNFTLLLNQFDMAPFVNRLYPERTMQGVVSGSASFAGKMSEPELSGSFGITGARFQDTSLDRLEGYLKYKQEKVDFSFRGNSELAGEVRIWGKASMTVALNPAHIGLYNDRPFNFRLDASDLSVGILDYFIPWLTELSGTVSLKAHVRGTPDDPEWNGKTRLTNVSCKVPEWGLSLAGLSGSADIKKNVVSIPEITVFSGDGRARLSGGFRIDNYSVSDLGLKLDADNFKAMNTPDINASVDAKLKLTGDLNYPRFRGKVKFTELTYRPPLILAYQGTSWESQDPTIRVKGEESEVAESSPLIDRGDLDIKIVIPDNARLRNSELNIRFGGELRMRKPPGGFFLLFGDLQTKDGWLNFQGKQFRIERGVFTFPAIPVIDPSLDLLASYRVPDYTTYIKITGTLSEPSLELYSDPPLDSADVLSVILFGRPMSELARGEQETLAQTGGQLAASYAASNLASSLGMALNLDTIVVETGKTAEESGVGIGKYVNEKLYLYYFQQFGEKATEEFRIRYEINKNFSVQASQDAEGQGGVDLYYTYTY